MLSLDNRDGGLKDRLWLDNSPLTPKCPKLTHSCTQTQAQMTTTWLKVISRETKYYK